MRPVRASRSAKTDEAPVGVSLLQPRPEFDRLFDALADAERLRLLQLLEQLPSNADRLALKLGWTRDAAAKQLKLLERAGLVRGERVGRPVLYSRVSPTLMAALHWSTDLWVRLPKVIKITDVDGLQPQQQVDLAGALRTPGRRGMLECMCRGGPITQGAAARDCGLSQGLASRGLTQLIAVQLVTVRTPGPPRRYAAVPDTMAAMVRGLHEQVGSAKVAEAQQQRFQAARTARAAARQAGG